MDGITLFSNWNKITKSHKDPGGSYKDAKNNFKPRKNDCYCDHCGIRGHTIERCWKVNGYPSDAKGRRRYNSGNQNGLGGFNRSANTIKFEEQQAHEKDIHTGLGNLTGLKKSHYVYSRLIWTTTEVDQQI